MVPAFNGDTKMALKDFLIKNKTLATLFAVGSLFVGTAASLQSAEKPSAKQPTSKVKAPTPSISNLNRVIKKIDLKTETITRRKLVEREGDISHLYLDGNGLLHTGIGLNINDYESFSKLNFVTKSGRLLRNEEKKSTFAKIRALQKKQKKRGFNYDASYYKDYFPVIPTKESQERLYRERLANSMSSVKKMLGFQAYYNLHPIAQSELATMHYNMGSNKFNSEKWPNLTAAAKAGDYIRMSEECHVKGIGEERNKQVAEGFKCAAKIKWPKVGTLYMQQHKTQPALKNNVTQNYKNKER